jgi:hypothetical protein
MKHEFFACTRSCPAADRRSQRRAAAVCAAVRALLAPHASGKAVENADIEPA